MKIKIIWDILQAVLKKIRTDLAVFSYSTARKRKCQEKRLKLVRGDSVKLIGDDPIIRCMERSGYPPWVDPDGNEFDKQEDEDETG